MTHVPTPSDAGAERRLAAEIDGLRRELEGDRVLDAEAITRRLDLIADLFLADSVPMPPPSGNREP